MPTVYNHDVNCCHQVPTVTKMGKGKDINSALLAKCYVLNLSFGNTRIYLHIIIIVLDDLKND